MNKNSNWLKDWRKRLLDTAWKSAPTKAKLSSTASSQDHLPTYGWIEKRWKKWTSSNTWDPHKPKKEGNINKGSNDQTGTRQGYQYYGKQGNIFTQRLNCTNLLSFQYCGSGDANPGFRRLILQEDSWHIMQSTIQTNIYGNIFVKRQELLLSTVYRNKLSWFDHVCRHNTLSKIIRQETVDSRRRKRRQAVIYEELR